MSARTCRDATEPRSYQLPAVDPVAHHRLRRHGGRPGRHIPGVLPGCRAGVRVSRGVGAICARTRCPRRRDAVYLRDTLAVLFGRRRRTRNRVTRAPLGSGGRTFRNVEGHERRTTPEAKGVFLLSRKRTFTVHVNIDDMAAMIAGLDGNDEKAGWLDGYLVGVHGHSQRESWTEAKRIGHEFGAKHFAEVEEFRAEQKRKSDLAEVAKSSKRHPDVTHGEPTGAGSGNPAGDPIQQSNNPLIQQPTIQNPSPLNPPRGKRFVPPTESEWVSYCGETWKDWHPECSAEAWAYYESKGWKIGSAPCKDWKAAARTSHGKAREWQRLQPIAGTTTPANSPGSPAGTRPMTPEEKNRLEGHRIDLQQAERDLRIAKNRPYDFDVDEAKRKVDAVRARILKMGKDPDAMMGKKDEPKEFDITLIPKEVLDRL